MCKYARCSRCKKMVPVPGHCGPELGAQHRAEMAAILERDFPNDRCTCPKEK